MALETGNRPSAEPGSGEAAAVAARVRHSQRMRLIETFMLPAAWVVLVAGFSLALPSSFPTINNFSTIFGSNTVLFVLAMALLVPLTNGDIDLSVGALSGLVSMVIALLNVQHHTNIWLCCLVGILIGAVAGFANGAIAIRFNADPFIITLGTGTVFTGVVEWISGEQSITGASQSLQKLYLDSFLGIPIEFYIGVAIMLVAWYVLTFTPFGQRCLFVGQSREVARLSGFRVGRIRMQGFVIAGVVAALSGVLAVATYGSANPGDGNNLLLPAYAAAFLGLTSVQPGRFNAVGAGIAVFFLGSGVAGMQLEGASDWVQQLFYGGVLVIAVVISRILRKQLESARE